MVEAEKKLIKENLLLLVLSLFIYTNLFRLTTGVSTSGEYYDMLYRFKILIFIFYLLYILMNLFRGAYDLGSIVFIIVLLPLSFCINAIFELDGIKIENIQRDMGFELFSYVLINIVYKDINYRKIIKTVFATFLILHSVAAIMVLYGILYNTISYRHLAPRYSLGFLWAAHLSYIMFYLTIYYVYLKKENISINAFFILIILNITVFYLTNTKLSFCLGVFILFASLMIKRLGNNYVNFKFTSNFLLIIVLLLPVLFFILSILYSPEIALLRFLNTALSRRLELTQSAISNEGISIIPHFIEHSSRISDYSVVDSSLIRYLLNYGITGFCILMFSLVYFIYLIYKNEDIWMAFVFFAVIVHLLFNVDLFTMSYNYLIFIWAYKNSYLCNGGNIRKLQ